MKPLSERDENNGTYHCTYVSGGYVGMKPLSERDENAALTITTGE